MIMEKWWRVIKYSFRNMGVNVMVIMLVLVMIYLLRPDCVWGFIRRSSSEFIELF